MIRGVFVTGTDTGVGKTLACAAMMHALRELGIRARPMKPIAAGASRTAGGWLNDDTRMLMEAAADSALDANDVTPVLLRDALAPHIAAGHEKRRIALDPVMAAFARLAKDGDFMVVEGVGGFCVPLDDGLDTVDLARAIGLPVVLVVGLRLGCLNHALLTASAIAASGLPLAGWIANAVDPAMAAREENVATLEARLHAPLLGTLPFAAAPEPALLAARLDVRPLGPAR